MNRINIFKFILRFPLVVLLTHISPFAHAQQQQHLPTNQAPEVVIDEKARALNVNDEDSVRALADAVFDYPHVFERMPAGLELIVKDRLVRAETGFLQGKTPGIREEDMALLVNRVVEKLKLPEFAKTSQKQIRAVRMKMAIDSPIFIASKMSNGTMQTGSSVKPELSPLQAVHILGVFVDQKFRDPNLQCPPEEWDRESHTRELERIKKRQEIAKTNPQARYYGMAQINPKRQELKDSLVRSTSTMTYMDVLELVDLAFQGLKIE